MQNQREVDANPNESPDQGGREAPFAPLSWQPFVEAYYRGIYTDGGASLPDFERIFWTKAAHEGNPALELPVQFHCREPGSLSGRHSVQTIEHIFY